MPPHHETRRMTALSVPQSWASLAAAGALDAVHAPGSETPGEAVAIHAVNQFVPSASKGVHREARLRLGRNWADTVPFGAVVATGRLVASEETEPNKLGAPEGVGRVWLWRLSDVGALADPVHVAGDKRRLWTWRPGRGRVGNGDGQVNLL